MGGTVRDIQKITGLSLSTISKYLNGGNVLPENREAIGNAIEALHYEVNQVARGLKTKKSNMVGLLIHDLNNYFAGTIISNIEDILRQHGYGMFICDSRGNPKLEKELITFLLGKQVEGIIIFPTGKSAKFLSPALEKEIPVVLVDRIFKQGVFDSVIVDNEKAAREAVEKLIEYGHKEIGIICGDDSSFTAVQRLHGYENALKQSYIEINEAHILKGDLSVEHGYDAMKKLLMLENRPTAVFLSNYEITLGAIIAMNEIGVSFPEELSIIGFDNMILAQIVKPKLWMVSQPMELIAENAAEIMLKRLAEKEKEPKSAMILSTQLMEGESIRRLNG